ncbi:MAG: DUF5020 family protein [Prevotellaceae bacterium]|jgi:hypothetical protein|nr:DUF5020 family protein [Prevotellaceae bacterium]
MTRKILFSVALFLVSGISMAQNLQLHYDPRSSLYGDNVSPENYLTATYEMFQPDNWGSTFMFVDLDFNLDNGNIGMAYAEIARAFKIGDFPLMPHIEYNGGLGNGFSIPNAYLAGAACPFQLGDFFMGAYVAYKLNAFEKASHDVQWTVTWNADFLNDKLSLAGFLDIWSENKDQLESTSGKKLIFLSEPQIWYNFTPNIALGSEVKLSYNFVNALVESKLYVIPTLAAKWNF